MLRLYLCYMQRFIITEEEKKHIKGLYEQKGLVTILKGLGKKLGLGVEKKVVQNKQLQSKISKLSKSDKGSLIPKLLNSFETEHLLKNCYNINYCDSKTIFNNFMEKIANIAKLSKFEPTSVKILNQTNVAGREIINVLLPNGEKILIYKSSGQNLATTGKKVGEWFVIPGFAKDGWFFKTKETIELTKGGNKYLTEFSNYLYENGSKGLSSGGVKSTVNTVTDIMKGQRVSNRWYDWKPDNIDFSKFTNKMSFDDLNKSIATAIQTKNWSLIPRAGFEKLGVSNMREYFQNNIVKINDIDPVTGRWSVIFK